MKYNRKEDKIYFSWYFEIKNIITGILTLYLLYWICKQYGVNDFISKSIGCLIVNLYFVRASVILDVVRCFIKSKK